MQGQHGRVRGAPNGPGLAKARPLPLFTTKHAVLARGNDPPWRALFERADCVSEGAVRAEGDARVWYGTTSLVLTVPEVRLHAAAVAFASQDLHVRLRALRTAHREASTRAPAPLGCSRCEVRFVSDPRGVRIDVDVEAPLIERRVGTARPRD